MIVLLKRRDGWRTSRAIVNIQPHEIHIHNAIRTPNLTNGDCWSRAKSNGWRYRHHSAMSCPPAWESTNYRGGVVAVVKAGSRSGLRRVGCTPYAARLCSGGDLLAIIANCLYCVDYSPCRNSGHGIGLHRGDVIEIGTSSSVFDLRRRSRRRYAYRRQIVNATVDVASPASTICPTSGIVTRCWNAE